MRGTRDLLSAEGSRTVTSELLAGKGAIEIQIVFGIGRVCFIQDSWGIRRSALESELFDSGRAQKRGVVEESIGGHGRSPFFLLIKRSSHAGGPTGTWTEMDKVLPGRCVLAGECRCRGWALEEQS